MNKDIHFQADKKSVFFVGLFSVVSILSLYNYLFAFSFLPLTEGWFSAYAQLIIQGKVPYRDFYLYLTPLYPLSLASIIKVFGGSFYVLRVAGVAIILGISVTLYCILNKRFKPLTAFLATVISMIYYQSGVAHIPYDFTQVLTLYSILTLWMFVLFLSDKENLIPIKNKFKLISYHIFFAGMFASLAFLTKQSNGAFVACSAFFTSIYLAVIFRRESKKIIYSFILGATIPLTLIFSWLLYQNALIPFAEQVFTGAISAKGSLDQILFSWVKGTFTLVYLIQMSEVFVWITKIALINAAIFLIFKLSNKKLKISFAKEIVSITLIFCVFLFGILGTYHDLLMNKFSNLYEFGGHLKNYIIPSVLTLVLGVLTLILLSVCFKFNARFKPEPLSVIVSIISFGMVVGNGTSAGLSEIGVFLMLAYGISLFIESKVTRYLGSFTIVILGFSLILNCISLKFTSPYSWWGVSEPDVRKALYQSTLPLAKGINLSEETAENLNNLDKLLSNSEVAGDIFAFPNIPIIYLIANRYPNSKVIVPWFDFLTDKSAIKEAERIKRNPPAIIVEFILPEISWTAHERLFRNFHPLGQREIKKAIDLLVINSSNYKLQFEKSSKDSEIRVWEVIRE